MGIWYNDRMNTTPNKSAKSLLSRLLASENIYVVHDAKAKTASFDIKSRLLTLPSYKNMTDEQYDMFIGHEVSHALFTPFTEEDEQCIKDHKCLSAAYKIAEGDEKLFALAHSYMNIVEDARIERLIKDKFAGLRRDFYIGYGELHKQDFFDLKGKNVSEFSLIDRINLYFKIGAHIEVPFTDEEMEFVYMVENTRSFDDVIEVTRKIWQYSKDKQNNHSSYDDIQIQVEVSDNGDDIDAENGNSKSLSKSKNTHGDWTTRSMKPEECMTQQSFDNKFKKFIADENERNNHNYYNIPSVNVENVVVPFKKVMDMFDDCTRFYPNQYSDHQIAADKFINDSNRVVNILAQAFFAKKAAKEHHRSMIHRTGVIDTVRMMDYKFNDDIFRRMKTVQKGKSHGLVFYMDLSGSMSPILEDTFKQLIQLVLFCKRVNIPFEVYGFTTKMTSGIEMDKYSDPVEVYSKMFKGCWNEGKNPYKDSTCPVNPFTLVNLFSSKMGKRDISVMIRNIFACSAYYKRGVYAYDIPPIMHLSSTPLIESIVAAMDMVPAFKEKNKLDIVHTVFLTDGEATGVHMEYANSHATKGNFTYDLDPHHNNEANMIQMFKEYTGSKAIQFFLSDTKTSLQVYPFWGSAYNQQTSETYDAANKSYLKEGWTLAYDKGTKYDGKFIIRADNAVEDTDLDEILAGRTSNVGIRNAFVKAMNATMVSRVMLNRFIDLIATE